MLPVYCNFVYKLIFGLVLLPNAFLEVSNILFQPQDVLHLLRICRTFLSIQESDCIFAQLHGLISEIVQHNHNTAVGTSIFEFPVDPLQIIDFLTEILHLLIELLQNKPVSLGLLPGFGVGLLEVHEFEMKLLIDCGQVADCLSGDPELLTQRDLGL